MNSLGFRRGDYIFGTVASLVEGRRRYWFGYGPGARLGVVRSFGLVGVGVGVRREDEDEDVRMVRMRRCVVTRRRS